MAYISTQFKITNRETEEFIVINDHDTDPKNLIALQAYPRFEADVRANNLINDSGHGTYKRPYYYGARTISFAGVIVGETEADVWQIKNKLEAVLEFSQQPDFDEMLKISFTDPLDRELTILATLSTSITFNRNLQDTTRLDFQFILRAGRPYLFIGDIDAPPTQVEDGIMGTISEGILLPLMLPFVTSQQATNIMTLTAEAKGVACVTLRGSALGKITFPTITNLTTGERIRVFTTIKNENEFVRINCATGQIFNQDGKNLNSMVVEGDVINLVVGDNELVYTAEQLREGAEFSVGIRSFII